MTAPRVQPALSLTPLLQRARRRWRVRHLAVGVAVAVIVLAVVLVVGSLALEAARFSSASIAVARSVLGIAVGLVTVRYLVWPLVRRLPDERLALYLEERVPQLGGAVHSAVTLRPQSETGHSMMLERGLIADAARRLAGSPAISVVERPATLRALSVALAVALISALLFQFGPPFLRTGVRRLLAPPQSAAAAPVYAIALEPAELVVPRGSDVQLGATLAGFESEAVDLMVRYGTRAEWERVRMGVGASRAAFVVRLFDVADDAEYYAEAAGVRSPIGKLTVKDLPGVQRIGVELRYPVYMNMPVDVTDDGGDIAAPNGTIAVLRVHTTRPVSGGSLLLDGGESLRLEKLDDSTVTARLPVRRDGFYRVELQSADGIVVRGTVEYAIDALEDAAPTVRIKQPGRDLRPTNVDEVLIEAEATDDYGISVLEVRYRVNGGEEKSVTLSQGSGVRPREIVAAYTLFLEEMGLTAGDVVSYYARAADNDQRPRPKSSTSDIQFLTIRPFSREYKQNQQGGGGGGGEQEMNPGSLVQRQRDIVAATFKTERDRSRTPAATLRGDISALHLSQGRLRQELVSLQARVSRPAAQAADTSFRILAEVLPKAGVEMAAAESLLVQGKTADALAPEQRALQWLEKAEAAFRDVQVSMQQQQGGGGGGGAANASDLADLLELQTDKMRNQYDDVQRSRAESGSRQTDETLERLKRLAARQQQELARQRAQQSGGSAGGGAQRQLAEEAEAAARQLERLAREQQSPEMNATAQQVKQAADAMRRSAGAGGAAAAQAAAERLESARRSLEAARQQSASSGLGEATARARALAEEQRGVQSDVETLGKSSGDRAGRQERLDERKQGMEERVRSLASDLDRLARENRRTNPRAAREAQSAAAAIRDSRLADKIRYSRDLLRSGATGASAHNLERSIQQDLDSLAERVAGAAGAAVAGRDSSQRSSRALAQARDLVRGLSSLNERLREESQRRAPGASGAGARQTQDRRAGASPAAPSQGGAPTGQRQGQGSGSAPQQGQGQHQGQQEGQGQGQGSRDGQSGSQSGAPGSRSGGSSGGNGQGAPGGAGEGGAASVEDVRQLSRELRARRDAAQQLRRSVQGSGVDTKELDRAIARLNALDGAQILGDPQALQQLRDGVVDALKSFEFTLRRRLAPPETAGPALGGSDQVPAQYREMVNEYFKGLAKKP
jgi:hypothetical protein